MPSQHFDICKFNSESVALFCMTISGIMTGVWIECKVGQFPDVLVGVGKPPGCSAGLQSINCIMGYVGMAEQLKEGKCEICPARLVFFHDIQALFNNWKSGCVNSSPGLPQLDQLDAQKSSLIFETLSAHALT